MVSLIGLVIGNTLARQADVPPDERSKFSLLGAASPSPLLGAVLVSAALRGRSEDNDGVDRSALEGDSAPRSLDLLRERRQPDGERQEQQEQVRRETLRQAQESLERERIRREQEGLFEDVSLALAEVHRALDEKSREPDVREAWDEFQRAVFQLTQAVEGRGDGDGDGDQGG